MSLFESSDPGESRDGRSNPRGRAQHERRQAYQASGIARSTLRYRAVARDDSGIITFMQTHMALNPRHGFGLLCDSARNQGKPSGKTVLWRVYYELLLNLPRRGQKRLPTRIKQPMQAAGQSNPGWSCNFMADALWSGRRFRTFNVIDEFNRGGWRIEVDTSLSAARVIRALNELVDVRGVPLSIRLDNGPEFIAHALAQWWQSRAMLSITSSPASPRRKPMSNHSTRPTVPRCSIATSSTACRKCVTRRPTGCTDTTTIDPMSPRLNLTGRAPCQTVSPPLLLLGSKLRGDFTAPLQIDGQR